MLKPLAICIFCLVIIFFLRSYQRKKKFLAICNLIGTHRDQIHTYAYPTWSENKFKGENNETIAAIVTGKVGNGGSGQADGNLAKDERARGDFQSPIRRFLNLLKVSEGTTRKLELALKNTSIGPYIATDIDCKSEDRIYPGMDYILKGSVMSFENEQYIRIGDSIPDQTRAQLNFGRIFASFQDDDLLVQVLEEKGMHLYGTPIFGITKIPSIIKVDEDGMMKWRGRVRDSSARWEHVTWEKHFQPRKEQVTIETMSIGEIDQKPLTNGKLDLKKESSYFRVVANGTISKAINLIAYDITPAARRKIEQAGGSVEVPSNGIGSYLLDHMSDDDLLPVGIYIQMGQPLSDPPKGEFPFRLTDEDQNSKWNRSLDATDHMFRHGLLYVFHHRDTMGRECTSVVKIKPSKVARTKVISGLKRKRSESGKKPNEPYWQNWYMFKENSRTEFYSIYNHRDKELLDFNTLDINNKDRGLLVRENIRNFENLRDFIKNGRLEQHEFSEPRKIKEIAMKKGISYDFCSLEPILLAQNVRTSRTSKQQWKNTYWKWPFRRSLKITSNKGRDLFLGSHQNLPEVPIYPQKSDWNEGNQQEDAAARFFNDVIVDFYRKWEHFAKKTNTSKNIGFGIYLEILVRIMFSYKGSRTETGADAYELSEEGFFQTTGLDGTPTRFFEHEMKTATGQSGDNMGSKDNVKVIHLGDKPEEFLKKNSFILSHAVDFKVKESGFLKIKICKSDNNSLAALHKGFIDFHSQTAPIRNRTGRANASYRKDWQINPPSKFNSDKFVGKGLKDVEFSRVAEFQEKKSPIFLEQTENFSNSRTNVCACEICQRGGAYWDPQIPRTEHGNALRIGSKIFNEIIDF